MSIEHFDLVVIGAGPAGEKGAAQAAYFGKRVCLVERAPKPGGAAVNAGAIPSKALRETALTLWSLRHRGLSGVEWHVKPDLGIADLLVRERRTVESEWERIERNLERHGIYTLQGTARFVGPDVLEVARYQQPVRRLSADAFLVATGARPQRHPVLPVDHDVIVDAAGILQLERIPARLVVVGEGTTACETASTFAALGSQVTLVLPGERLLPRLDGETDDALATAFVERLGIAIVRNAAVIACEVADGRARLDLTDDRELQAECICVAGGWEGATGDLGTEAAGVALDADGFIRVDARFRSSNPKVWAAGDVIGPPFRASAAMEQARVAMCHAFDLRYKQALAANQPWIAWTIPEVATVGETEESLRARGVGYEVGRASFGGNARGLLVGETTGFVKLLFHPGDQRLLGATVVGEGASELIHVAMAALQHDGTLDFFIQSGFGYPTFAETFKYAAYDGLQRRARRIGSMPGLRHTPLPSMAIVENERRRSTPELGVPRAVPAPPAGDETP